LIEATPVPETPMQDEHDQKKQQKRERVVIQKTLYKRSTLLYRNIEISNKRICIRGTELDRGRNIGTGFARTY
jgi:hypothetical protein